MTIEGAIRLGGSPGQAAPRPVDEGGGSPLLPTGKGAGSANLSSIGIGGANVANMVRSNASFSLDESSGLVTIKIVNSQTGEVIRRIPPRDYVQMTLSSGPAKGTLFEARS